MPLDKHTWYTKIYKNIKYKDDWRKNKSMFRLETLRNILRYYMIVAGMRISKNTDRGFWTEIFQEM